MMLNWRNKPAMPYPGKKTGACFLPKQFGYNFGCGDFID
jgi:hypothetical protein